MSSPNSHPQVSHEASSSNAPTTSTGKARRHKLPLDASKILEDYINMHGFWENNPTGMPNKSAKDKLLADVKKLPGTEFYKMMNLSNWFRYRQSVKHQRDCSENARAASASVSTSNGQTSNNRYHSLSTNTITSLSTLCKDTPNPSQDTIALWVKFLCHETPGVTLEDVNRFVSDCHNSQIANPATAERIDADNDAIQVDNGNVNSGLPTPGNTASPTIIPSRPMWMTPDPFSVKTRNSQSPILNSMHGGSASTSVSASGSVPESVSPCVQPVTPARLLGVSHPLMDDMDADRYTPVAARRRTPSEHADTTVTQTNVDPLLSPSPQSRFQSRSSLSPPQMHMHMMGPVSNNSPRSKSSSSPPPPRVPSAQPELEEADNDMDISASPSPASAVVSLPAEEHTEPSPAAPNAIATDFGILQAILQGLASVRDSAVPMVPEVACPTNKAEFDAAFARFDSTCMMIGEMLDTREAHES